MQRLNFHHSGGAGVRRCSSWSGLRYHAKGSALNGKTVKQGMGKMKAKTASRNTVQKMHSVDYGLLTLSRKDMKKTHAVGGIHPQSKRQER
jgi:hypothetical protein